MRPGAFSITILVLALSVVPATMAIAQTSPFIYGIHDHDTNIQEYLNHFSAGGVTGWVTATVASLKLAFEY